MSECTDIAFLYLAPYSENALNHTTWKTPKMNLLPPNVGTRIQGFGYPKSEITDMILNEKNINLTWGDSPSTTIGKVMEIHSEKRDSSMLNFPCFRTNARMDTGMSGGPVFNEKGELCGIVCSSLEMENVSYVASLWPSMATMIDFEREDIAPGTKYPVLDLVRSGYMSALNWQKLSLEDNRISLRLE
jgi:hypothetical protein